MEKRSEVTEFELVRGKSLLKQFEEIEERLEVLEEALEASLSIKSRIGERLCDACGIMFYASKKAKYCCNACRQAAYTARKKVEHIDSA